MSENIDDLLTAWFDGDEDNIDATNFDETEILESSELIGRSLLVDGLISELGARDEERDALRIHNAMSAIAGESNIVNSEETETDVKHLANRRRTFLVLATAMSASAAVVVLFFVAGQQRNVSAAMLLEKVIEAASKPSDRAYLVSVVEEYPRGRKPRNLSPEAWVSAPEELIDGSTLFVRGANQYVLTVQLRNGLRRTSGCNGELSWAFREDGPVHITSNLSRFRGSVPGQQQQIPFMNMNSHLSQLRDGYSLELANDPDAAGGAVKIRGLSGVRKSRDIRGPKRIEIWFDSANGKIHKMLLDGLPRGRGGPKSLMLELVGESSLSPDFFSHEAHHEPGRQVRYEDVSP